MSRIVIVDYSCGNIDSVQSAVNYHGQTSVITKDSEVIKNAENIIPNLDGLNSWNLGKNADLLSIIIFPKIGN